MSNALDDRSMAQGMLYNFHLELGTTHREIQALMKMRDLAREAGIYLKANEGGQIEARRISEIKEQPGLEGRVVATGMFI